MSERRTVAGIERVLGRDANDRLANLVRTSLRWPSIELTLKLANVGARIQGVTNSSVEVPRRSVDLKLHNARGVLGADGNRRAGKVRGERDEQGDATTSNSGRDGESDECKRLRTY